MVAFSSPTYSNSQASITEGIAKNIIAMHDTITVPSTLAINDVLNFFYLPPGAVVTGFTMRTPTAIESATTMTWDLGITGATTQFLSTSTTPGRAAGAFSSTQVANGAGALYKNTTSSKVLVLATVHAAAATPVAGTVELAMTYFIEEAAGSVA